MAVRNQSSGWIAKAFLQEPSPFSTKRDINWSRVKKLLAILIVVIIVGLLLLPTGDKPQSKFQEASKPESGASTAQRGPEQSTDNWAMLQQSRQNSPSFLSSSSASSAGSDGPTRNSSMIISREGTESKANLPAGSKISLKLSGRVVVANQGMPVIAEVSQDVVHEDSVAIPQGSKLFGTASFNDSSDHCQVVWQSVRFPNGSERRISALAFDKSGQIGAEGRVRSQAIKNVVGQMLSRFVSAYAEGSMEKGPLGASQGGNENGLRNAVAETAKDRAEAYATDLKKEQRWIELDSDLTAVTNQPFVFRDPGTIHGQ